MGTGTYGTDPKPTPYSPSGNLWYFTGRQYDPEIGSYNYRARQYHPTLGQFMSVDPTGTWGDPVNLGNPYAYVGNNPGSHRDPMGLITGQDVWWGAARFGTAVAAFVPCGCTDWAREEVRETYENFRAREDVPLLVRVGAEFIGPPQTQGEAVLSLVPFGGVEGKGASVGLRLASRAPGGVTLADDATKLAAKSDLFAGVRELSITLRGQGVPRADRLDLIKSFERGTISAKSATGEDTFLRFWGGASRETGRFLTPGLEAGQDAAKALGLPPGNTAEHLTQFSLKPGTRYFEGTVAPTKWGHPGGGRQIFVPDSEALVPNVYWR